MPVSGNWLVETDTKVTIRGLTDENGAFINDATDTAQLWDKTAPVTGAENIALTYIPASNGEYTGIVPASLPLKEASSYDLFVTAVRGGKQITVRVKRTAKYLDV
jgi:hypothetical protein